MKVLRILSVAVLACELGACALQAPYQPADVILQDAHGGGSTVRFNAQETLLASGGWAGKLRLWRLPLGEAVHTWSAHSDEVTGIAFVDADQRIVTAGYDGWLKSWRASGALLQQVDSHSPIRSMVVDEPENLIITGHVDGSVRRWRLDALRLIEQRQYHEKAIRAVAWSAATKTIASSSFDGAVWLWPIAAQPYALAAPPSDARTLQFAENGAVLIGGGWFNLFRWTLADGHMDVLGTEHVGIIRNMQLLREDGLLATISRQTDSAVLFLDATTGQVKKRFQPHDLCGADVTVSRTQRFMATTSDDASVRIWWLQQANRTTVQ